MPVQLSLASADAAPDEVRLSWFGAGGLEATVQRREPTSTWRDLGSADIDGADVLAFVDRSVSPVLFGPG